jgi:hypothetical protein
MKCVANAARKGIGLDRRFASGKRSESLEWNVRIRTDVEN